MTFEEASSISLVGQTVLDSIAKAAPTPGARVLVLGASGGVGTIAVQVCKARGLTVIGVCSAKNRDLVLGLGADDIIDYTQDDWSVKLANEKVEVVFDFAPSGPSSTDSWNKAQQVLARSGRFITISGHHPEGVVTVGSFLSDSVGTMVNNTFGNFSYHFVLKVSAADKLRDLAAMVEARKLKPVVEEVYPWENVHDAFVKLLSGRASGKLVITAPA